MLYLSPRSGLRITTPGAPETGARVTKEITSHVSVMGVVTCVAACLACLSLTAAYRAELPPQKWSPQYFQYRFFPPQNTFKRRMPSYVQVNHT